MLSQIDQKDDNSYSYKEIISDKMKDRLKSDFSLRHSPFYQAQISKPKGKGYKKMKSAK